MKNIFKTIMISAIAALAACAIAAASALSIEADGETLSPAQLKTVATARLDLVFEDGTIFLQALSGQDKLDRNTFYYLVYLDNYAARIQFVSIGSSILEARIVKNMPVKFLPTDTIVSIAKEDLSSPAKLMTAGSPEQLATRFRPIRTRGATPPFGIVATVDLIISDTEMLFYPRQYVGLLDGDIVAVSDALGRRIIAEVKASDKSYVSLHVTQGSAHLFKHGSIVFVTDVPRNEDWGFTAQPNQKILPDVPRPVKPAKPNFLD